MSKTIILLDDDIKALLDGEKIETWTFGDETIYVKIDEWQQSQGGPPGLHDMDDDRQ